MPLKSIRLHLCCLAVLLSSVSLAQGFEQLVPKVISVRPHDPAAFTQGLLSEDGVFYESTGLKGESSLRRVDPATGKVLAKVAVPEAYFAEGLALVGDSLIQLTWQEGKAFIYDVETLEQTGEFSYEGEGWGLCYDGSQLYLSDGSNTLFLRDPETFALEGELGVTAGGQGVPLLNELECVGDFIYANVWKTDLILKIAKASGQVESVINAAGLLNASQAAGADVLNGIAYDAAKDVFYLTGKRWPLLFEVKFVQP
jgi:glutaminyl-peptide cyclotransferase